MLLDCKAIFAGLDSELPFSCEMNLNEHEVFSDLEPVAPAKVDGTVHNEAGIVTCSMNVHFRLRMACDRCAEQFERDFSFSGEAVLVTKLNREEDDEYILIPDAQLDVEEFAESVILLNMPTKVLCKPDCQGVCPICGQNLNVQTCSCQKKSVDPRLEALRQLLE